MHRLGNVKPTDDAATTNKPTFSFSLRKKINGEALFAFILAQVIQSLCMHIFCCLVSFKNYAMQHLTI